MSVLRTSIGVIGLLLVPVMSPVQAQSVHASIGGFAARHGAGIEIDGGMRHVSLFVRAEGFESTLASGGLRARLRLTGGSIYVSGFVGSGRCPVAELGGVATGCDGDWHTLIGAALGLELDASRHVSLFVDGGRIHMTDSSTDLPPWTFAAGIRFKPVIGR